MANSDFLVTVGDIYIYIYIYILLLQVLKLLELNKDFLHRNIRLFLFSSDAGSTEEFYALRQNK